MKKRALSLLLALVMVVGILPTVSASEVIASGTCGENLTWVLDVNGTMTISGEGTMDDYSSYADSNTAAWSKYVSSIKRVIVSNGVKSIGKAAFYECNSVSNVTLPYSIVSIGDKAFYGCDRLTEITLPASTTKIGTFAFSSCINLNKIIVDANNPNYCSDNYGALLSKDMTKLLLVPSTVTGNYAIPEGVELVEHSAFEGCTQITSITVSATVTNLSAFIGYGMDSPDGIGYSIADVFAGCIKLSRITVAKGNRIYSNDAGGALYNYEQSELICVPVGTVGSYTISDGVTLIRDYAFLNCKQITSVTVSKSVNEFKDSVFMHCNQLQKVFFTGDIPILTTFLWVPDYGVVSYGSFGDITADIFYPANNQTWFEIPSENYGGHITWIPYTPNPFTDVPSDSFYEAPVLWALENNITTGATATTFNPDGQCQRAQVVTFLHRAAKNPEPTSTKNPFSDVKTSDFFYKPVLWAVEKGITNGTGGNKFGSYDVCNRAAVVTFLWRAAGSPEPKATKNPFKDVKTSDFFYKPVLWAVENGITNGVDASHFGPTSPCNRAQVVTFLYRAYD